MSTLKSLLAEGRRLLFEAGIEDADLDAWLWLEYLTKKNRAYYFAHADEAVSNEQAAAYMEGIRKRSRHVPLQQLTHQAFFMGYEFYVNEHVLTPRQDTEVLAEAALEKMKNLEHPQILDMCTGSGCLLLSLLCEKEGAAGIGADVSEDALAVAEKNRDRLGLTGRAELVKSDLFSAEELQKEAPYDLLVSNPPYIRSGEIGSLMEEVRLYDPLLALDGHEDGLYFYRRICREGGAYLKKGGWLLFEIGYDQGQDVAALMRENGFTEVKLQKDLAGLDRVVLGKKPEE